MSNSAVTIDWFNGCSNRTQTHCQESCGVSTSNTVEFSKSAPKRKRKNITVSMIGMSKRREARVLIRFSKIETLLCVRTNAGRKQGVQHQLLAKQVQDSRQVGRVSKGQFGDEGPDDGPVAVVQAEASVAKFGRTTVGGRRRSLVHSLRGDDPGEVVAVLLIRKRLQNITKISPLNWG